MSSDLRSARTLLVIGGVLAVLRIELGPLPAGVPDLVQGTGIVLLFVAGLRVRAATGDAPVDTQTGIAVTLLGLAPLFYFAGLQGHPSGMAAAPSWAAGVLLTTWAAARALDLADVRDAEVWSLAHVLGVLVWTPVAIVLARIVWATTVEGVDGVDLRVDGAEGLLVTLIMLLPFLLLLGRTSTTRADVEVRA